MMGLAQWKILLSHFHEKAHIKHRRRMASNFIFGFYCFSGYSTDPD